MFAIVCTVRMTAVAKVDMRKISKLPFWPNNTFRKILRLQIAKIQHTVNVILQSVRNVGNDDLNYVCHSLASGHRRSRKS